MKCPFCKSQLENTIICNVIINELICKNCQFILNGQKHSKIVIAKNTVNLFLSNINVDLLLNYNTNQTFIKTYDDFTSCYLSFIKINYILDISNISKLENKIKTIINLQ